MSIKNWPGGRISDEPPVPSGPYQDSTASGVWTLEQQAYWDAQNLWPTAGNIAPDPFFENVTMLLHGDGTNGGQNNTFLDSSTNNFTITRSGNTTQGSFSPYGTLWSNFFDGNGDYLYDYTNTTPYAFGTGDFTVEAWVNFAATTGTQGIADSENTTGTNTQADRWFFEKTSAGNLAFGRHNVGIVASGTWAPASGVWYHVAACRSGTTLRLFVNGTQVASATDSTSYAADGIQIGVDATPNWFNGYISNLRVVKGTALYTSAFTPSTTPLTAVSGTSILTCQSNRFIDTSANNVTLTVNGNTSVQRFSPFQPTAAYSTATIGGSGYFDGAEDYLEVSDNAALTFGTGDYTVQFWAYRTAAATQAIVMFASNAFVVLIDGSGGAYIYDGNVRNAGSAPLNAWNHYAFCRASGTLKMFVNGVEVYSASANSNWVNNATLRVGASLSGGSTVNPFTGYLSNLQIVKGTAVYTSSFTPPTAPVTAVSGTGLLTNFTNGAIFDNAMMNDLETVGNAQISTSVVKFGTGSISLNGSNDYLPVSNLTGLYNFGTGNFTVEAWVYLNNLSSLQTVFAAGGSNSNGFTFAIDTSGTPFLYFNAFFYGSTGAVSANAWVHIAWVRNNGSLVIYVNGVGSTPQAFTSSNQSASVWVGGNPSSAGERVNGYIDDLRITKGVARYTANFTPPTAAFPDF